MANASDYLEQAIYNHLFRETTFAKPIPKIALSLNVPTDAGAFTEVTGAGYARYPNASGNNVWDAMTAPGSGQNTIEFSFGPASADWGTVSGVVILDQSDNVLMHGTLASPRNVQSGDTFKFSAAALKISIQ
jgi:hypothetical protein